MKLRIYKTNNRYAFSLDGFSSVHHHIIFPDVQPTYQYAWQAMRDAKKIYKTREASIALFRQRRYAVEDLAKPVIAEPDPEHLLLGHYQTMLSEMSKKSMGIDDNTEEEKKMTYLMIKSQVEDLLRIQDNVKEDRVKDKINKLINGYRKIVQEHFSSYLAQDKKEKESVDNVPPEAQMPAPPQSPESATPPTNNLTMASKKIVLTDDELVELMEHYGNRVCAVIAKHHPDAVCKIFPEKGSMKILGLDKGSELLDIHMNDRFTVDNIIPCSDLAGTFPSYSPHFYQRYWKPIVEALGHFFLEELEALVLPEKRALPDMPNGSGDFSITGWHPNQLQEIPMSLSFKDKTPMWMLAKSEKIVKTANEYTEEDFLRTQPTRLRCIDSKLSSLYGKIGEMVQLIPLNSGVGFEVDVNFGRKIVRLSKDQVEIVNDI